MAVSSSSLFHFTRKENLKSILQSGKFWPSFCEFDLYHGEQFWRKINGELQLQKPENLLLKIPMVCFCDMLLTQIKLHIQDYGESKGGYGIGLKKEWGKRKNLCPITYLNVGSPVAISYLNIWEYILKQSIIYNKHNTQAPKILEILNDNIIKAIFFSKPFEGYSFKPSGEWREFYNEREWRYIPENEITKKMMDGKFHIDYDLEISKIRESDSLTFKHDDISFLIVNSEAEIEELIDIIREMDIGQKEQDKLLTKIQSVESIEKNYGLH